MFLHHFLFALQTLKISFATAACLSNVARIKLIKCSILDFDQRRVLYSATVSKKISPHNSFILCYQGRARELFMRMFSAHVTHVTFNIPVTH